MMHFHFPSLFRPKPFSARDRMAGIQDQIIELGTHLRFLEADRLVPQPRDDAGRFVSKRDLVRKQLAEACSSLTPEQRRSAQLAAELKRTAR